MPTTAPPVPKLCDFMSRNGSLRLVRVGELMGPNAYGQFVVHRKGIAYQFTAGRLQIAEGVDVLPDGPLEYAEDGTVKHGLQDAVTWLRNHRLYNTQDEAAGFYEVGREPDRLQPYEEDVREQILAAAVALSDTDLERIIEEERTGHNRAVLVREAEQALQRVLVAREELQAAAEASVAENAQNAASEAPKPATKTSAAKKTAKG